MLSLTATIGTAVTTLDLADLGALSYSVSHSVRTQVWLYGDGSADVEDVGDSPTRYRISGEYRLGVTAAANFAILESMRRRVITVSHGTASVGTAYIGSLRTARNRLLGRQAPLQRWELELVFKTGGAALGLYLAAETPDEPDSPTPTPEPGPVTPPPQPAQPAARFGDLTAGVSWSLSAGTPLRYGVPIIGPTGAVLEALPDGWELSVQQRQPLPAALRLVGITISGDITEGAAVGTDHIVGLQLSAPANAQGARVTTTASLTIRVVA